MLERLSDVLETMRRFGEQLLAVLPQLLAAFLLLILGWIVARLFRRGMIRLLRFIRLDVAAEKTGVESFLMQGGVRYTAVTLIANLFYWGILFAVMLAVMDSLGLQSASALFGKVIGFLPQIFAATIVLIFGGLFSGFLKGVVKTYLENIGVAGGSLISSIVQWALLLFVISVALEQLSIGVQIIVAAFQIAFGAFCLALAIAFGLGGKDVAATILERLLKK